MDQQTYSGDQQLQQSSQVETDQQTIGEERKWCCSIIKLQFDPVAGIKNKVKNAVKSSNIKSHFTLVTRVLKGKSKEITIIPEVGLFIFFLANFIHSVVNFAVKQKPLAYNIVCNIVASVSLIVSLCKLVCTLVRRCKTVQNSNKIKPEDDKENKYLTAMKIEENAQTQDNPVQQMSENQLDSLTIVKELIIKFLQEYFLYPVIICSLYGLVNEKQWQFNDTLAGYGFLLFLYSVCMDALYTKLKYVWVVQKLIVSLSCDDDDTWKKVLTKSILPSLFIMPHIIIFALMYWVILMIIGIRIYVDSFSGEIDENVGNFSGEIDQVNTSNTGNYKVAPWTGYMIFCGFYLPAFSVLTFHVLNRAWLLDDETESRGDKIFYFLHDPWVYSVVPFLIVPFIAFCVGIYLPDYDSSEFEVDPNAKSTAEILGLIFIIVFLLCNIRAAVIFAITVIVLPIAIVITVVCCIDDIVNYLKQ